jgi:hypothetical protein
MYLLNLSNSTLSFIKRSISLLFCLSLFACSSTEQVSESYFTDNGYTRGYVSESFSHSQFTPSNKNTIKKALPSDHYLMMSLLNRPVTADQAMMLAFAQERASYSNTYSSYAVQIKGDKSSDTPNNKTVHAYAALISQDINAVSITAPK